MISKIKALLFRDLLYLKEVVKIGQICATARKNGVKASNLSKILKDLETRFNTKFLTRTPHGVLPTHEALLLTQKIEQIEDELDSVLKNFNATGSLKTLKLFLPANLEIKNLYKYQKTKVMISSSEKNADVIVSFKKPQKAEQMITVENTFGKGVVQSVWVCCINKPEALDLARFIISQILDQ